MKLNGNRRSFVSLLAVAVFLLSMASTGGMTMPVLRNDVGNRIITHGAVPLNPAKGPGGGAGTQVSWNEDHNSTTNEWSWQNRNWLFGPQPTFDIYHQNGSLLTRDSYAEIGEQLRFVVTIPRGVFTLGTILSGAELRGHYTSNSMNFSADFGFGFNAFAYVDRWYAQSHKYNSSDKGLPPIEPSFVQIVPANCTNSTDSSYYHVTLAIQFLSGTPLGLYQLELSVRDSNNAWIGSYNYGSGWEFQGIAVGMAPTLAWGQSYGGSYTLQKLDLEGDALYSVSRNKDFVMRYNVSGDTPEYVLLGFMLPSSIEGVFNVTGWHDELQTTFGGWEYSPHLGTYVWNASIAVSRMKQTFGSFLEHQMIATGTSKLVNITVLEWEFNNATHVNDPVLKIHSTWVYGQMFFVYNGTTRHFEAYYGYIYVGYRHATYVQGTGNEEVMVFEPMPPEVPVLFKLNSSLCVARRIGAEFVVDFAGHFTPIMPTDTEMMGFSFTDIVMGPHNQRYGPAAYSESPRQSYSDYQMAKQIAVEKPVTIAKLLKADGNEPTGCVFQVDKGKDFMVRGRLQGGSSIAADIDGVQFVMDAYDSYWRPDEYGSSELTYEIEYDMMGIPSLRAFNWTQKNNYTLGSYMTWVLVNVTGWHYVWDSMTSTWIWGNGTYSEWRWMEVEGWHWQQWYFNRLSGKWQEEFVNPRSAETAIVPDFCVTSGFTSQRIGGDLYCSFLVNMSHTVPDTNYWWNLAFLNNTWYTDYAGSWGEHPVLSWKQEWVYSFEYSGKSIYIDNLRDNQLAFYNATLSPDYLYGLETPCIEIDGEVLPIYVRENYDPMTDKVYTNFFNYDHSDPATGKEYYYYELANDTSHKILVTHSDVAHIHNVTTSTGDTFLTSMEYDLSWFNGSTWNYYWIAINGNIHQGGLEYQRSNLLSFTLFDNVETNFSQTLWYARYDNLSYLKINQIWWESVDNCYYMTDIDGTLYQLVYDGLRSVYQTVIGGHTYDISWPERYYTAMYNGSEVILARATQYYYWYTELGGVRHEMPFPKANALFLYNLASTESNGGKVRTTKSVVFEGVVHPVYEVGGPGYFCDIMGVPYHLDMYTMKYLEANNTAIWNPTDLGVAEDAGFFASDFAFTKVASVEYAPWNPMGDPRPSGNYFMFDLLNGTVWNATRSYAFQVFQYILNGSSFYSQMTYPWSWTEGNFTYYYYTAINGTNIIVPTWEGLPRVGVNPCYSYRNETGYDVYDFMSQTYQLRSFSGIVFGYKVLNDTAYSGDLFVNMQSQPHRILQFLYHGVLVNATATFGDVQRMQTTWGYPVVYGPTPISSTTCKNFDNFIVGIPNWGMWGMKNWVMNPDNGALDLDGDLGTVNDQYYVQELYNSTNTQTHEWNRMNVHLTWNPNATMMGDEMNINSWLGIDTFNWSSQWSQTYYWYHASGFSQLNSTEMQAVKDTVLTPGGESRPGYWDIAWMAKNATWADIVAQAEANDWDWIKSNEQSRTWLSFGISQDYGTTYTSGSVDNWLHVGIHYEFSGLMIWNDTNGNGIMDVNTMSSSGSELSHYLMPDSVRSVEFVTPGMTYNNAAPSGSIAVGVTSEVIWGVKFYGVNGTVFPYTLGGYWGWYDSVMTGSDLRTFDERPAGVTIDVLSFLVHFKGHLNATSLNNYATVKVDNYVGNWDVDMIGGRENLANKSLALNYFAEVNMQSFAFKANGTLTGTESTVSAETFEFETAGAKFAQMIMGNTTYDWSKNTTMPYDVLSCTTPLGTFRTAYQSSSGYSATAWSFSTTMYYVTIGFPEWDGYSVYQDPVFVSYVSNRGATSGPGGVSFGAFSMMPSVPSSSDSVSIGVDIYASEPIMSVDLDYRTDFSWKATSMSQTGLNHYVGTIPPYADNVQVYYKVVVHTSSGDTESVVFSYIVGKGAVTTTTNTEGPAGGINVIVVLIGGAVAAVVAIVAVLMMRKKH